MYGQIAIWPFSIKGHKNFWTAKCQFSHTQVIQKFTLKLKHKRNLRKSKHTSVGMGLRNWTVTQWHIQEFPGWAEGSIPRGHLWLCRLFPENCMKLKTKMASLVLHWILQWDLVTEKYIQPVKLHLWNEDIAFKCETSLSFNLVKS